ncbi:MAG: hypothetical protein LKF37_10080 [Lentilactobacillus diolivorans]|nr:hypothetical protein [Lentilactobacillus diolivorans]
MKLQNLVVGVVTSLIGVGLLSTPQQASAATWHKGIPAIFKGKWRSTETDSYHFYKYSFDEWQTDVGYAPTAYKNSRVKYKLFGKWYCQLHYYNLKAQKYYTTTFKYINKNKMKIVAGGYMNRY